MRFRKTLLILAALLLVLSAPTVGLADTSGDDETDVEDITSNTGVEALTDAQPGQNYVMVQAVRVKDPGSFGDTAEDGFDTAIETATVKKVVSSTLEDRFVRKVKLYLDSDSGKFEAGEDFLLGEVSNPNLTEGVTFGSTGTLLALVEDKSGGGEESIFFVVVDLADDSPDGSTLRTSFDLTVSDSLIGGPTISSGFDPAAFPPVLRGGLEPGYAFLRITATTGKDETDIIDETPATTANPGDLVVLQQFTIADPGPTGYRGGATGDNNPTLVRNISVRKSAGSADVSRVLKLMLYKESAATPPNFQPQDELLGTISNPNLDAGVVFHNNGRRLLRVDDESEERLYIVAQLSAVGFEDGDTLQTEVSIVAKNDPGVTKATGDGVSSGIETPMPVIASSPLTIEVPPPTIFIGPCLPPEVGPPCDWEDDLFELKPTVEGTIHVAVRYVPEPGLGEFQLGPLGAIVYDPTVLEVTAVKGVSPYRVETYDVLTPGLVFFIAALKPGREGINEGPVVELTIKAVEGVEPGTETEITIEDEFGVEIVDAFKDADGKDLVPDIVPGRVKIKLIAGDVDGDSIVTVTDARMVARYILGLERFTEEQREAADVAPPLGLIDVTDVRYIAQAAAGLRQLDPETVGGVSAFASNHNKLGFFGGLLRLLGFYPSSRTQMTARINGDRFTVASHGTRPVDIQGTLRFDPAAVRVERIVGVNGYTVLASQVDNAAGRVRFVASLIDGVPTGEAILEFEIEGGTPASLKLDFDLLRDAQGRDITANIYSFGVAKLALSQVLARRHAYGIEFEALGAGIEQSKVEIFNLAGVKVFDSGFASGSTQEWRLMNNHGQVLANGVYLYVVTVKGFDGSTIRSEIRKLVILR